MRKFSLIAMMLLILTTVGGIAWGQVAAPRLIPGTPHFLLNPATLPGSMPSYIGLGSISMTVESTPVGNTAQEVASGTGTAVQGSFANESFGVGFDFLTLELELDPTIGSDKFNIEDTTIGLGMMLGEVLALGVGLESGSEEDTSALFESSMVVAGGTLKLGETFFVGGTYGTRTVDGTNKIGTGTATGEQTVSRVGAGLYSRDAEGGFHAEVYRELGELLEVRDDLDNLVFAEESEAIGVVLEARFSNIVIGYESISETVDKLNPGNIPPLVTREDKETRIILGWSPQEGLGLTLVAFNDENTDEIGNVEAQAGTIVNLNFAF